MQKREPKLNNNYKLTWFDKIESKLEKLFS